MRSLYLISLILIIFVSVSGQAQVSNDIKVGETLVIESSEDYNYSFIKLPKPNFIIKKGGTLNYDQLDGALVEVTKIKTSGNNTMVSLKRKDGKKFFGSFPEIRANYQKAIKAGELSK
ncbi:hypothetical protein [Gramella sp. MAR_2010_147]|uniref:hypothetical protein n=1 Tax=Gramella sp. MAR_2010_147 TaxID=1250205 RepID=UPI00087DE520|nr:hypothetical protein [Gramella sp. MAR_2010_147]SDR86747.1 hypothetical protein SAMN04488553_0900 [Gramella sp. MAR_2010_147]